jgi:hypothetical protein
MKDERLRKKEERRKKKEEMRKEMRNKKTGLFAPALKGATLYQKKKL